MVTLLLLLLVPLRHFVVLCQCVGSSLQPQSRLPAQRQQESEYPVGSLLIARKINGLERVETNYRLPDEPSSTARSWGRTCLLLG
jgi:hypothetical protein